MLPKKFLHALSRENIFSPRRSMMTATEAATALRPFYFAVHPDLFGQFPEIKSVNEQSLKALNGYLDTLCRGGLRSTSSGALSLTFYLRSIHHRERASIGRETREVFRPVSIRLNGRADATSAVRAILESCSLPTEHLPKTATHHRTSSAPIDWKFYYDAYTRGDTSADTKDSNDFDDASMAQFWARVLNGQGRQAKEQAKNAMRTLRDAFAKLGNEARHARAAHDAVRREVDVVLGELAAFRIEWGTDWALTHMRGTLVMLQRALREWYSPRPSRDVADAAEWRPTLRFARGSSFLAADGAIVLGLDDVAEEWLRVLAKYAAPATAPARLRATMEATEDQERRVLDALAGVGSGMTLARRVDRSMLEYTLALRALETRLMEFLKEKQIPNLAKILPAEARDRVLQIVLDEDADATIELSESGIVVVPSGIEISTLIDFLRERATIAQYKEHVWAEQEHRLESARRSLVDEFGALAVGWNAETLMERRVAGEAAERLIAALRKAPAGERNALRALAVQFVPAEQPYRLMSDGRLAVPVDFVF